VAPGGLPETLIAATVALNVPAIMLGP